MKTWVRTLTSSTFEILKSYMPEVDAQERANNLGQIFACDLDTEIMDEELDQFLSPSSVKIGIPDLQVRQGVLRKIQNEVSRLKK